MIDHEPAGATDFLAALARAAAAGVERQPSEHGVVAHVLRDGAAPVVVSVSAREIRMNQAEDDMADLARARWQCALHVARSRRRAKGDA